MMEVVNYAVYIAINMLFFVQSEKLMRIGAVGKRNRIDLHLYVRDKR